MTELFPPLIPTLASFPTTLKRSERIVAVEGRSWSDLLPELLEEILTRLPPSCHPSFASVCASWNRVALPVYPADETPLMVYFKKWRDGDFQYYSPKANKSFKVRCTLDLSNAELYFARDGWLLLYREHEVILANPLSNTMHAFPGLPYLNNFTGISFAGCPPNDFDGSRPNDFLIFAIESMFEKHVEISIWDDEGWDSDIWCDNDFPFLASANSSPVLYDGCFYCLGTKGNLGVFDMEDDTWTVLENPRRFPGKADESCLVESEGKLTAILFGRHNETFQILQLNQRMKVWEWERKTTIRRQTLFVGPQSSLVTPALSKQMENTIFYCSFRGVPETIEAAIRCSQGRLYFVRKHREQCKSEGGNKTTAGSVCSSKPGHSLGYCGSIMYSCSIWYEPKIIEKL